MEWKTFSLEEECLESYEHTKINHTGIFETNIPRTFLKIVSVCENYCVYMPCKIG